MKKIIGYFIIGIISALSAVVFTTYFNREHTTIINENNTPVKLASYNGNFSNDAFVQAAQMSTPAVVHINTIIKAKKMDKRQMQQMNPFFKIVFLSAMAEIVAS